MPARIDPQFEPRRFLSLRFSELLPILGILLLIAYLLSA